MSKRAPETQEAPACVHDEMEAYYVAGSPNADAFAPGMLDEADLQSPTTAEATPWRRRGAWIADLARRSAQVARQRQQRRRLPEVTPESLADPKHVRKQEAVPEPEEPQPEARETVQLSDIHVLVVHPNLGTRK